MSFSTCFHVFFLTLVRYNFFSFHSDFTFYNSDRHAALIFSALTLISFFFLPFFLNLISFCLYVFRFLLISFDETFFRYGDDGRTHFVSGRKRSGKSVYSKEFGCSVILFHGVKKKYPPVIAVKNKKHGNLAEITAVQNMFPNAIIISSEKGSFDSERIILAFEMIRHEFPKGVLNIHLDKAKIHVSNKTRYYFKTSFPKAWIWYIFAGLTGVLQNHDVPGGIFFLFKYGNLF